MKQYEILLHIYIEQGIAVRAEMGFCRNLIIQTANTHSHADYNLLTSLHSVSRHFRWTHLRGEKKTRYFYFQLWKSLLHKYAFSVSVIKITFGSRNSGRFPFLQNIRYFNLCTIEQPQASQNVRTAPVSILNATLFFYQSATPPPPVDQGLPIIEVSRSHSVILTTLSRTPLDEWSARRTDLYLATHNNHNTQTSTLRLV